MYIVYQLLPAYPYSVGDPPETTPDADWKRRKDAYFHTLAEVEDYINIAGLPEFGVPVRVPDSRLARWVLVKEVSPTEAANIKMDVLMTKHLRRHSRQPQLQHFFVDEDRVYRYL